jgi:hypothetical protein
MFDCAGRSRAGRCTSYALVQLRMDQSADEWLLGDVMALLPFRPDRRRIATVTKYSVAQGTSEVRKNWVGHYQAHWLTRNRARVCADIRSRARPLRVGALLARASDRHTSPIDDHSASVTATQPVALTGERGNARSARLVSLDHHHVRFRSSVFAVDVDHWIRAPLRCGGCRNNWSGSLQCGGSG